MALRWYAVHTLSMHEKKVSELIMRRGDALGLWNTFIVEILIPTEPELSHRNGKRTVIQKKLFPGYILVRMDLTDDVFKLIKSTSGVTAATGPIWRRRWPGTHFRFPSPISAATPSVRR
jgi:transcriptional antiterminator NusG